jgi:hypothetical protein
VELEFGDTPFFVLDGIPHPFVIQYLTIYLDYIAVYLLGGDFYFISFGEI